MVNTLISFTQSLFFDIHRIISTSPVVLELLLLCIFVCNSLLTDDQNINRGVQGEVAYDVDKDVSYRLKRGAVTMAGHLRAERRKRKIYTLQLCHRILLGIDACVYEGQRLCSIQLIDAPENYGKHFKHKINTWISIFFIMSVQF